MINIQPDNQTDSVRLRRYSVRLVTSGIAFIFFGGWDVIRTAIYTFLKRGEIVQLANEAVSALEDVPPQYVKLAIYLFVVLFMVMALSFSMLLHVYVGSRAIAEGREKKRTSFYLVLASALVILTIAAWLYLLHVGGNTPDARVDEVIDEDTGITEKILTFSMCLVCVDMVYSAIRMRLIRRRRG